jgi:hypothetical protein
MLSYFSAFAFLICPIVKKCGKKLSFLDGKHSDRQKTSDGLCTIWHNYTEPLKDGPGEMGIVQLSPAEYESWVRTYGSKVEIINVEKLAEGLYSGGKLPISYRRLGGYLVTYRKK